jgi:tetratricopeptide (TPR) repeat protein
MSAANDASFSEAPLPPAASTAITASPAAPPDDSRITLPPLPGPAAPSRAAEQLHRELARLDLGLAAITLLLAFFLASFAVRNSDFWMHLAQGRLYAHGNFNFKFDPYLYTENHAVNHSWLPDLLLYGLATLLGGAETPVGGAVLVVLKALLVVALAGVMMAIRRPGQSLWAPAGCTALAVIALSPRLPFQPWLLSLLFLALTLYMLQRPRHEAGPAGRTAPKPRSPLAVYWLLPPLFLLWVNLDRWFFLGPLTVALFLLGEGVQRLVNPIRTGEDAPEPGQLRTLVLILIAGLAACFVNPYHYKAWVLPAQLSWQTPFQLLAQDPIYRQLFGSPFQLESRSIAALAYFPLLALGALSFLLTLRSWRWWRFFVWAAFAVLAGLEGRLIPFFAVVAGPITALNFQDLARSWSGTLGRTGSLGKLWSLGGRITTLVLGLVALLAAWPGWLHGRPDDWDLGANHRVAWHVDVAPGLRDAAVQLKAWHTAGLLSADRPGFNYGPDILNYCAWFCADDQTFLPLERGFCDYRIEAFPEAVIKEYIQARQALDPQTRADSTSGSWQEVFRKHQINRLLLSDSDRGTIHLSTIGNALLADWSQWKLVFLDEGRTSICLWHDPQPPAKDQPAIPRFEPGPLAFGPHAVQASAQGPGRGPQPRDLFERYWRGPAEPSARVQLLPRYLEYYDVVRRIWPFRALPAGEFGSWTGTVAQAPATPGVATVLAPATWMLTSVPVRTAMVGFPEPQKLFIRGKEVGPTAALLLAIRAGRQAIADSPDAAFTSYLGLGTAYQEIWDSVEQHWQRANPRPNVIGQRHPREQLRQIQVITGLESALKLQPHDESTHRLLFGVYFRSQYYDVALDHLREIVRLTKAAGPQPQETREDFNGRLEREENQLKALDTTVTRTETEFELKGANLPLLYRAQLAQRNGLAGKALELLLQATPDEMNQAAGDMQIQLLLTTGRHLDPEVKFLERLEALRDLPGMPYQRYGCLYEASLGNYEQAGAYLEDAIRQMEQTAMVQVLESIKTHTYILPGAGSTQRLNAILEDIKLTADYRVLRGMLALEQGDTATAARFFERALNSGDGQPFDFESRPIALGYLNLIQRASH